MLRDGGYDIHDFADCQTYEQYKAMGESEANIYFLENSEPAAKDMKRRLKQEALYLTYSYDYAVLRQNLQTAADAFGLTMPDCDAYEQEIEAKLRPSSKSGIDAHCHRLYGDAASLGAGQVPLDPCFKVYAVYLVRFYRGKRMPFDFLTEGISGPRIAVGHAL